MDNTGRYQIDITGPMYGSSDLDAHNLGIVVQQALSADNVPNHMKNGALLHRVFSDRIDLRLLSGDTIFVPEAVFDELIDEQTIIGQGWGMYFLA